ncbi:MAG: 4a-hydroxytetrahydrobiopterin dehydratase [Maritimibacter sp.]
MTQPNDLAKEPCLDLPKGTPPLDEATLSALLPQGWNIVEGRLVRRYKTANFAQALDLAVRAGAVAEAANHHPDITFGWGYCELRFYTHSINGLSRNDLIAAAKINEAELGA